MLIKHFFFFKEKEVKNEKNWKTVCIISALNSYYIGMFCLPHIQSCKISEHYKCLIELQLHPVYLLILASVEFIFVWYILCIYSYIQEVYSSFCMCKYMYCYT